MIRRLKKKKNGRKKCQKEFLTHQRYAYTQILEGDVNK